MFFLVITLQSGGYEVFGAEPNKEEWKNAPVTWVAPNEQYPQDAYGILHQAPKGAYVTVGTERGFIQAAKYSNFSSLILTDASPAVVHFNQVNLALLKCSQNKEHYFSLRMKSTKQDWKKLTQATNTLTAEERELLADPNTWDWWKNTVRNPGEVGKWRFENLHYPPTVKIDMPFEGANYLYEQDQYDHLSKLAKTGKINVVPVDFRELKQLSKISNALKNTGEKISVLDLSNAWWNSHIGFENTQKISESLIPKSNSRAILLITDTSKGTNPHTWNYYGYSLNSFKEKPFLKVIEKSMILGTLDGKSVMNPCDGFLNFLKSESGIR